MGRYILRRTAVAVLLSAFFSVSNLLCSENAEESRMVVELRTSINKTYQESRHHLGDSKAWSEGFNDFTRPEVVSWIDRWLSDTGREKIIISQQRRSKYRTEVDAILRNAGIPWELMAIPVVESNWRLNAVSSSGAAGPWQFLETSGRGRGLVIDMWRDDRRDPWRSSEAAADELKFNHGIFSDWILAVAAYNAGPTRLRKIKKSGNYADFWAMYDAGVLPEETKNYVPQILAVTYIEAHAGRLGFPLNWVKPQKWARITFNRSIHLNALAEVANVDVTMLYAAHPELHQHITPPPDGKYSVKIPIDAVERIHLWRKELLHNNAPRRFWRYTVQSGDSLSAIATHFGIPLDVLIRYNTHMDGKILRIGERLFIPGDASIPAGVDIEVLPDWPHRYKVQAGDSLWAIAHRYGLSPESLANANHRPLVGTLLIGSILRVPYHRTENP